MIFMSMIKTTLLTLLIAGVFIVGSLASNEAFGTFEAFLKIDDIKGESTDAEHEGEIEIESWSWGETNSGTSTGGGGGAGKVSIQDFHFVMQFDKASPKLMEAVADGKHFEEALLTIRKAGGDAGGEPVEYLKITMKDLVISSYQTAGSSGEDVPVDSVSLNFANIKYEYTPQKGDEREPVNGFAAKPGHRRA